MKCKGMKLKNSVPRFHPYSAKKCGTLKDLNAVKTARLINCLGEQLGRGNFSFFQSSAFSRDRASLFEKAMKKLSPSKLYDGINFLYRLFYQTRPALSRKRIKISERKSNYILAKLDFSVIYVIIKRYF